jgi:hypothetical protein
MAEMMLRGNYFRNVIFGENYPECNTSQKISMTCAWENERKPEMTNILLLETNVHHPVMRVRNCSLNKLKTIGAGFFYACGV